MQQDALTFEVRLFIILQLGPRRVATQHAPETLREMRDACRQVQALEELLSRGPGLVWRAVGVLEDFVGAADVCEACHCLPVHTCRVKDRQRLQSAVVALRLSTAAIGLIRGGITTQDNNNSRSKQK